MLRKTALTSAFVSFSAVRAFPAYAAESPWKLPGTDVKVPEKSLGCPSLRTPSGNLAHASTVSGATARQRPMAGLRDTQGYVVALSMSRALDSDFAYSGPPAVAGIALGSCPPLRTNAESRPTHYETMSVRVAWWFVVLRDDVLPDQNMCGRLARAAL